MKYQVLISEITMQKIIAYQQAIGRGKPVGGYLHESATANEVSVERLSSITPFYFLHLLIQTKKPKILAESEIEGNGRDWNASELSILGDVNIAVPVTIFDNGVHNEEGEGRIENHAEPLQGELLFVPSALLRNDCGNILPDMEEVVPGGRMEYDERSGKNIYKGQINDEAFYKLYERRLLPSLIYASENADRRGAIVTIPSIGCGQFAGDFEGTLEVKVEETLKRLLDEHGDKLPNIRAVNFDPNHPNFEYLDKTQETTHGIKLVTKTGNFGVKNSQLQSPSAYGEEYKDCKLYSIAAWNHVSWPGNDFYRQNDRSTDDGVKAAATDVCAILTGNAGKYDEAQHKFKPLIKSDWETVIQNYELYLQSKRNTKIFCVGEVLDQPQEISSHSAPPLRAASSSVPYGYPTAGGVVYQDNAYTPSAMSSSAFGKREMGNSAPTKSVGHPLPIPAGRMPSTVISAARSQERTVARDTCSFDQAIEAMKTQFGLKRKPTFGHGSAHHLEQVAGRHKDAITKQDIADTLRAMGVNHTQADLKRVMELAVTIEGKGAGGR